MTLKEFFKTYPVKPQHVANKAGISYGTMRHYMRGSKTPSDKALFKIQVAVQEIAEELLSVKII